MTQTQKPVFYCWPCDARFHLATGDGLPPQSGICVCRRCGSTDIYWLAAKGKVANGFEPENAARRA